MKKLQAKYILFFIFSFISLFIMSQEEKRFIYKESSEKSIKRAIVIGATAGMGRAVAKLLAQDGFIIGLVGRRVNLLESLQKEIETPTFIKQIDVSKHEQAKDKLIELIDTMGGMDLILISIRAWYSPYEIYSWKEEKSKLKVDLMGFWAMAHTAINFFEKQKKGHLAAISSMSGLRGSASCPAYCGAKSFISTYLEGVRNKMIQNNIPIYVTDIIPGWVDVEHSTYSDQPGTYWVASLNNAAQQIFDALKKKKKVAYITKRQIIIAFLLKIIPDCIFNWIGEF